MTTKEKIEVMQAYLDGKTIQWSIKENVWNDIDFENDHDWDWYNNDYRIKPEEKKTISVTGEELSIMNCYAWFRDKNSKIRFVFKRYVPKTVGEKIFNPETKCWEDWGEE